MDIMGLEIESDFELRKIRDVEGDVDIFIDIKDKTLNMLVDDMPSAIASRIQFCMVRGILIRLAGGDSKVGTVHILRSIDLYSAISNFEIDYSNSKIAIADRDEYAVIEIKNK